MTRDDVHLAAKMECIALDLAELNAALELVHGLVVCLGKQKQLERDVERTVHG